MSVDDINKMLTKESGLLGLTEVTSDCRYVEDNYAEKLTLNVQWTFIATAGEVHRFLHRADGRPSGCCYLHRWYR